MKKLLNKSNLLFLWFILIGLFLPMQVSAYYIAGWGGDWNFKDMGSTNSITFKTQTAGDYSFKITNEANWNYEHACGTPVAVVGVVQTNSCNNGNNISVKLTKNADVTISYNGTTITITANEITADLTCYLRGSFDSWGDGKEMTLNGGEYQITNVSLTAGQEVKIYYGDNNAGYSQVENPASYISKDNQYDNIVIEETGTYSFYYKISSNLIWLVQESTSSDDEEDDYIDALKCDPANTKIIFTETFGAFTDNKDRASYSRTLATHGYVARVGSNYSAMTTSCTAIKDKGNYAVVANPKWAGCGEQANGDTYACSCNDSWWYLEMEDHTSGDTNGGMLMFNCNDGTTTTDILYECELEVCAETYINFSAWIAPANALRSGCTAYQDAGVKFILKDKNSGEQIATKTIKNIKLNAGWQDVSVMFNAGEADNATDNKKEVVLQFINVAVDGNCGNDLLIDDITLSVCTPQAVLETSNGTPTSTILLGKTETLTTEITSGLMDDPYYLWQVSDTRTGTWINLTDGAVQNKATYTVTPDSPNLQYRVIIAPSLEDITKGLANVNTNNDICGMYAITNTATVTSKTLALDVSAPDDQICVDGEDNTTIEISVTNPLGTNVTGVTVNIDNLADFTATKTSGAGTYSAGVWTIGDIAAGATQTLKLKLISTKSITASSSRFLQSYVKTVSGISYSSYTDAPDDSKKQTQVTLNPLPEALFSVNKETICDGSPTSEIAINVNKGTANYTLTVDGEDYSTSTVPYILEVTPSTTKTYTLTQVKDSKGCIYKPTQNNTATVTVEKLSITTQPTNQTVCVGGKATFTVVAEGATKYTWEVSKDNKTWELIADASTTSSTYTTPAVTADDNGKYYRVNVCKDGGKCGIITSNPAELIVTTIDKPTLLNNGKYDECSTTGDISLSTLFSGTALKYYSDPELKSEITTGTFSASEIVNDKPYYATQTINGCTSDAAIATVTVKQLPKLTSVVTNNNAICGTDTDSKATLTYNITGGKSPYGLTIQRTEGNSTSTTTTEVKLESPGTYDVKPSSDATYKFIKVSDSNGCYSEDEDGLVDDITIDVQNILLLEDLADRTVCADKTLDYIIKASGDNLNYQWYESVDNGVTFNKVGTNSSSYKTNAFEITDKKQYKVDVYQSPEVCSAINSKESAVTVTDCSRLSLSYGLESQSATVCMGEEIKFKYTLTNSSDAANIIVNITNIADQKLKGTANASLGEYDHDKGVWNVGNIAKGAEATLEITIVGSTAVKDKVSTVYVSQAGTTEYTIANTIAISTQTITVKNITQAPALIAETYKACPESGMLDLETQISSDKTNLKFYTSETGTTYVTQASKSEEGTTPYWVTSTKDGECESPRTQLDIVVYPQPTAELTGDATICNGKPAYLAIKLSGTPNYTVTYAANVDGTETDKKLDEISDSEISVPVYPTETTTYSLKEVKDGNNCSATLSGGATVTVNYPPTINGIPKELSVVHVCDGDVLPLPTLTTTENGSTITNEEWYFNGKLYKEGDAVSFTDGIKDKELQLEYLVSNSCGDTREKVGLFIIEPRPELESFEIEAENDIICAGSTTDLKATFKGTAPFTFYINNEKITTNLSEWSMKISKAGEYKLTALSDKYCTAESSAEVTLTLEELPVVSLDATNVPLNCSKPSATITASGAYRYEWQDDKGSALKTGDKLTIQQTDISKPELTTTYTIYGYSEKANCKSKDAKTLTVTEDFVKPIVDITAPTDILTCTQISIDLTVDASNNTENIVEYIWDGGTASSASTYPITSQGNHTLKVKGENGCYSDEVTKNITQNINKPTISIKSYNLPAAGESTKREETEVITCSYKTLYLETTVDETTDPDKVGYSWSNGDGDFSTEVTSAGTYTVTVTDKVNGCTQTASIDITKDDSAANISKISSITTLDESSENYKETTELTCTITSLILNPAVSNVTSASYEWSKLDKETGKYNKIGEEKNQTVNEPGDYKLVVIDNDNGCSAEEYITITQNINKPEISIKSYDSPYTSESVNRVETQVVTCTNSTLYLETTVSKITDTDEIGYSWSNGSDKFSTEVSSAGTYTVIVTDKANGCTQTASIDITKDENAATISGISSVTTLDEKSEIYAETTELTCAITSLILNPSVSNVTSASYEWSKLDKVSGEYNKIGDELTQKITEKGVYKFVVTDNATGCTTYEEVTITENKRTPVIEDIISVNSTDKTVEGYKETQIINCKDTELFISSVINDNIDEKYSPEELEYVWTISKDNGENYKEYGTAETISTTSKAIFKLVVTDKETGCPAEAKTIEITEEKTTPTITAMTSVSTIEPGAEKVEETSVLTCKYPVLYLKPTIESENEVSYKWGDGSTKDYLEVEEAGTYTLIVTDETTFCSTESYSYPVTENKRTPVIDDIISANSTDEKVEGYKETQIINCKDTELFISSVIKDNIDEKYSPEELNYSWTVSYDDGKNYEEYGTAETISTTSKAIFKLVVTDKETGCPAEAKTIEITEEKTTPTITAMTSVSTIDPGAEKVEETSVLTCEYPVLYLKPTIESENEVSYKWDNGSTENYREVKDEGTYTLVVTDETTFCSTEEYSYPIKEDKNIPGLVIESVYELCPSDTLTTLTLSSFLPKTEGVTYKFYDESGEEIEDVYEVSSESPVTTYYVIGTAANGCQSEKTSFEVDFAKNVDFTLTTSQSSMMVGGNETIVEIVPDADSDDAATYVWTANDQELSVDGLQYVDNLYLDTNFKVTASNRCDSDTQEAFVEVLWPTAFTPHNGNGKNDTFAKGMKLMVFNRFYTKIFEGEDGWDGSINGTMNSSKQTAVPGVYFYSVQLPNGQVKKGTIEIVKVD